MKNILIVSATSGKNYQLAQEIDSLLKIKSHHLSGGQKKRLVIAMALINEPNILLI